MNANTTTEGNQLHNPTRVRYPILPVCHDNIHENTQAGASAKVMDAAVEHNHFHVLKRLHDNHTEGCTTSAIDNAVSVELTEWLHLNRTEDCTTLAMDNAAERGDVDTLLFPHTYRTEGCTIQAAMRAHRCGHLAIFEWLVDNYPDVMKLEDLRGQIDENKPDFLSPLFAEIKSVKRQRFSWL